MNMCVQVGEAIIRGSEMRMASSAYSAAYNEAKGLIMVSHLRRCRSRGLTLVCVKAFKAKGSKKYGPSATGSFFGKGEGAKESLGMMSI